MVDPTPAPVAEEAAPPVEQSSETPISPVLDVTGLSPEVAAAMQQAYGHLDNPAPPTEAAPVADPASEDVQEAAQDAEDEGDDDTEPLEAVAETEPADSTEPKLSRAQRAEQRRKAEVDTAVADALAARDAQQKAQQELERRQADDARIMADVSVIMASDVDEQALIDQVANGDFEAADKLKTVREARKQANAIFAAAEKITYGKLWQDVQAAKTLPGVDPSVVDGFTTFPALFQHISEGAAKVSQAALAAKDVEWQTKLDRQKAEYESRLGRAASRLPTTEVGGRAVGAPPQLTLADVQRMFRTGDYKEFAGKESELMALYHSGQLK